MQAAASWLHNPEGYNHVLCQLHTFQEQLILQNPLNGAHPENSTDWEENVIRGIGCLIQAQQKGERNPQRDAFREELQGITKSQNLQDIPILSEILEIKSNFTRRMKESEIWREELPEEVILLETLLGIPKSQSGPPLPIDIFGNEHLQKTKGGKTGEKVNNLLKKTKYLFRTKPGPIEMCLNLGRKTQ